MEVENICECIKKCQEHTLCWYFSFGDSNDDFDNCYLHEKHVGGGNPRDIDDETNSKYKNHKYHCYAYPGKN